MRALVCVLTFVAGCDFPAADNKDVPTNQPVPDAIEIPDAYIPDASASGCLMAPTVECAGPVLRTCSQVGQQPTDVLCPWSCSALNGPHCAKLQPSGGAVTETDLDDPQNQLGDISINSLVTGTIDTSTGAIQNVRSAGTGIKSKIDFQVRNGVGIFRVKSLTIDGGLSISVVGTNALAIVATDSVTIKVVLDVQGSCSTTTAGPGGFAGGGAQTDGQGDGKGLHGSGTHDDASGGAGGAYGATGGDGGNSRTQGGGKGGTVYGDANITHLVGGAGGSGGGGTAGGVGGGGGGAIQIVSNGLVHFQGGNFLAGIHAGGCNGKTGADAGGGGGAGGAILIEAPNVTLDKALFDVNGGGGAGANTGSSGDPGQFSQSRANGGQGAQNEGDGGRGGATSTSVGSPGTSDNKNAGGGAGGVGWIRFNTYSGFFTLNNSYLSPPLTTTTTTQATADVR